MREKVSTYGKIASSVDTADPYLERSYANERLATEPFGPPDAYSGRRSRIEQQGRRFLPYGGFGAPRNPFAPGGSSYDRQFSDRPRSASHAGSRFNDEERRRRDFYRSHVAEPWGVAEYDAYEVSTDQSDSDVNTS